MARAVYNVSALCTVIARDKADTDSKPMRIAEETFAKIAEGIAGAFEHSKDAKLYNVISGALKKE